MKKAVVIGAGITGCCAAYFLAKKGVSVSLLDPSGEGTHATKNNPGGLNPLHGPGIPGVMSALALRSFELHKELQAEIKKAASIDFKGHVVSRLELAFTVDELEELKKAEPLYNSTDGFSAEQLTPEQVQQRYPRIAPGVLGALLTTGNGMVNGLDYARAVSAAGQKLGVRLIKSTATGITKTGSRVEQVLTQHQPLDCDAVVFATGPWFDTPSRWMNLPFPIRPLKGQLLLARLPGKPPPCHITKGLLAGLYVTADGRVWLGGTQEDAGFDVSPTAEGREAILSAVSGFFPDIRNAVILEHVAALRPVTPDRLPLIGKVPGFENAYIAGGAGVKGMLLATGMAEAVTAGITGGRIDGSVTPFLPGRFSPRKDLPACP